ncbi:DUF3558 domain-containing protein [Actinoalloteichus hymeniacidonis]|uniref:DUF3558 family protein n=1 Tax=Actinoalloteichus hymeniacidonis TaxID=340345 RepID=A0AAC9HNK1_9PSEU|nr:DUF3558 domain-containing protein [Actinoalloteichus hymeniacidonis]AOS62393.1 putative DUF3558 family protein [Actinoalloteichus hymeniacidonis]MBB5909577.1 hypothetical protein [Actinoalloteichus hymeniacidonis]
MNRTLRSTLCATALAALALAGCSNETGGEATPSGPTTDAPGETSAATDTETSGAEGDRAVEDLDIGGGAEDPCSLLTTDQVTGYGFAEAGEVRESGVSTPECKWSNREGTSLTDVYVHHDNTPGGLTGLISREANFPFFESGVEVVGRPAVHTDITAAPEGQCSTYVDLTADSTLSIYVYISEDDAAAYSDPCAKADEVAAQVIENIQGGI